MAYVFKIPAKIEKLQDVLHFLKEDMRSHSIDEKVQFNVVVASEEIFTNIAQYAYTHEAGLAEIRTEFDQNFYSVIFIDTGKRYNPLERENPDITMPFGDRNIGGLGILLVKKLADDVSYQYQDGKNILKISMKVV